jgi:hypothetical protein
MFVPIVFCDAFGNMPQESRAHLAKVTWTTAVHAKIYFHLFSPRFFFAKTRISPLKTWKTPDSFPDRSDKIQKIKKTTLEAPRTISKYPTNIPKLRQPFPNVRR